MVFQPTSPVKSFAVVQRAATVKKKRKSEASTMLSTTGSFKGQISDSVPSDLSQADTQRNSQLSAYTINTGGKARTSWGRMSRLFNRSSEALRTENKLSKPNPNAPAPKDEADSPTDPMYDPDTQTFRAELPAKEKKVFEKRMSKETAKSPIDAAMKTFKASSPKIDMPPIAVTGPDEPRSFLDLNSSSDEETPTIQRASSVKVSKPRIVRHNSRSAARIPRISEAAQAGPAMNETGQPLRNDLKNLRGLTSHEKTDSVGGPAEALKLLEGTESDDGSTVALLPTPPSRIQTAQESIKETIVDIPSQACATTDSAMPSPDTGVKSQQGDIITSSKASPHSPLFDGLRSNPLSNIERTNLSRTMSAPIPANRIPNRRVTIRPADLVIHHTDNDHRLFRETIVATPYPNRLSMVNESTENRLAYTFDEKHRILAALPDLSTVPAIRPHPQVSTSITPTPIEKTGDRFPSPSQPEHLFLTLCLPSPTPLSNTGFAISPSTTIDIEIPDRATFDDEQLFIVVRRSYLHQLLGLKRRVFFSRTLSHATPGSQDMHLDAAGFVAHLTLPKLGRKKKGWLIWLRHQQPLPKRASSMFSGHSPADSHTSYVPGHGHGESGGSHVSAYWSPTSHGGNGSPVPRMPFSRIQSRDLPPRVVLHYRFSVVAIITALCMVALVSVMSTILWVLFGVPGQAAGAVARDTIFGSVGWKREAEFRVLTGLVMGIVVSLLGVGGVGCWCFGGWVLL